MARPVHVASGSADVQGYTGSTTLMGYSVSAGAAATVVLRNGTSTAAPAVALVNLAAAGSETGVLPAVDCPDGVFVDRVTGTSELVLYVF